MNENYLNNKFVNTSDYSNRNFNTESKGQQYIPIEESYIENILRLNKGKKVYIYQSYPCDSEWQNKVFEGILEECGKDHIIISNPSTGNWYMLLMIYVNFIKFDEDINSKEQFYSSKI